MHCCNFWTNHLIKQLVGISGISVVPSYFFFYKKNSSYHLNISQFVFPGPLFERKNNHWKSITFYHLMLLSGKPSYFFTVSPRESEVAKKTQMYYFVLLYLCIYVIVLFICCHCQVFLSFLKTHIVLLFYCVHVLFICCQSEGVWSRPEGTNCGGRQCWQSGPEIRLQVTQYIEVRNKMT